MGKGWNAPGGLRLIRDKRRSSRAQRAIGARRGYGIPPQRNQRPDALIAAAPIGSRSQRYL
jgi:hypothetical protein